MLFKVFVQSATLLILCQLALPLAITSDLETAPSEVQQYQQGGGKQFFAAQQSARGEKGNKGYLGHHEAEKGAKGYHDKERQQKQFAEAGGNKKGYRHQDGYYGQQQQGQKGQKGYHYQDEGSYAKGHSTKGRHNVHKLDEYKKDTDFFDEDHDEAHKEKHGGYELKNGAAAGKYNAGGFYKKLYLDADFGRLGNYAKGSHYFNDKGHKLAQGHDGFYALGADFAKKGGNDAFKNYGYTQYYH